MKQRILKGERNTSHQFEIDFFPQKWDERLKRVLKDYRNYSLTNEHQKSYSEFLEASLREILIIQEDFAIYKYPAVERAIKALLKDWKLLDVRRFNESEKESVPPHLQMEVEKGVHESLLEDGICYYQNLTNRRKLIVRFGVEANFEGVKYFVRVFFVTKKIEETFLRNFIQEIRDWVKDNHYLKGKKVKPGGSLLKIGKKYTFDDIVLSQEIMTEIEENVLDFFQNREAYIRNGLPRKRGLILYGEPGTGKTLLGKVLCSQIDCTFIWVTPSKLSLPVEVSHLFEMARELSPTIIYLEDLDFYASNRSKYGGGNIKLLGEILNQMDGFGENGDIVVIAATNDIESIEPALKERPSRFDRVLELKLPDLWGRKTLLKRLLPLRDGSDEIIENVTQKTDGYNGAQVNELVILAKKEALKSGDIDDMGIVQLKMDHFETALTRMKKKKEFFVGFKHD
jgi:SpoVK/Ycf46/Vps4 family AAA+-type ATPase